MKIKKVSEFSKYPVEDKVILTIGYTVLGLFVAAIVVPVIYIILASFIDPITLQNSGLTFDFSKWTLTAYERVMSNEQIWVASRMLCCTPFCSPSSQWPSPCWPLTPGPGRNSRAESSSTPFTSSPCSSAAV